jgi:hypothetical protein
VHAVLYVGLGVRRNSGGNENVPMIHQAAFSQVEVKDILLKPLEVNRMGGSSTNAGMSDFEMQKRSYMVYD